MYINPHCPPQGHVLGEYLRWGRICIPGDINGCLNPEYISQSHLSPNIIQGAFGNQYLIDALRMLACEPRFLRQILVSNKYADRGKYRPLCSIQGSLCEYPMIQVSTHSSFIRQGNGDM